MNAYRKLRGAVILHGDQTGEFSNRSDKCEPDECVIAGHTDVLTIEARSVMCIAIARVLADTGFSPQLKDEAIVGRLSLGAGRPEPVRERLGSAQCGRISVPYLEGRLFRVRNFALVGAVPGSYLHDDDEGKLPHRRVPTFQRPATCTVEPAVTPAVTAPW
jgi:hypothetical protein